MCELSYKKYVTSEKYIFIVTKKELTNTKNKKIIGKMRNVDNIGKINSKIA